MFKRIMAALKPKPKLWGDDKPEGYPPGMPEFAREAYDQMKTKTIDEIFDDLDAEIEKERG